MMCYMDQWWCKKYKDCDNPCNRALTPEVQADADKWWGEGKGGAPIEVQINPRCFKEQV
jgi:hypothetical protein